MQDTDMLKRISGTVFSPTILHREALVTKLNEVLAGSSSSSEQRARRCKLVMLCAPAGYGKTTLLADFAHHSQLPCCWYVLEASDVDKATFLSVLMHSLRHQFPGFGQTLDALLSRAIAADVHKPSQAHFDAVVDALVLAMSTEIGQRFALFLCNYHLVNSSASVNHLVNHLLSNLPPQCIVVIESRAVPALDFAALFAHDEIMGIDHTLLRFSAPEIQQLARVQGLAALSAKEAEQLTSVFDGWIAGILLGTRLGDLRLLRARREVYTLTSVPEMQIDRHTLFAYLVGEVFSRDLELYTFLKETAVLEQMTPAVCDAVLETTDSAERLHALEQQGLFVTRRAESTPITYTCHPLLRELLCDEVRRQSPERFVVLHRRAIEVWRAAHDYEQAIRHALAAHLDDLAASLILEVHDQVFTQGRMELLSRWIEALPPTVLARYPQLLLVWANISLFFNDYTQALPLLEKAAASIVQDPSLVPADERPVLQATISIARSKALHQRGDYAQAQVLCREVIEQLPADEVSLHAEAHMRLGAITNRLGHYSECIAHFQKALHLWGRNSERWQTAVVHSNLAHNYSLIGNFALAEHHFACATRCYDRLQDGRGRIHNVLNMGLLKHQQGEFAAAEACFHDALTMARGPLHFQHGEAYALLDLGALYQDQGRYEQALACIEESLALARHLKDRYLANCALCFLAMTYLLMGDVETATFFITEAKSEAAFETVGGYLRAQRELVRGAILLHHRHYEEASACLSELEQYLRSIGLQGELLCATLRLAECQLAQGHTAEAVQRVGALLPMILRHNDEQFVLIELRILPTLKQAITTMPELAQLRALLQSELKLKAGQEGQEDVEENVQEAGLSASAIPTRELVSRDPAPTGKARIKILALGEPSILIDEQPVTRWRMARAMELFFLLMESRRPLRKEQIITALWPEADDRITQTLHSTIHYLRKSLGESCITSHGGTYQLNFTTLYGQEVWYDVAIFQEHYAKARQALERKDDATAQTELVAMVELYRGDYVQSFYSDWSSFQRDKLRQAYIDAHHQLALIALRAEHYDESATHWQHMLAVDDCMENAHYGLMRCYARQGKRGLALRQYQRCVEVLQRELSIAPGTAMQNLQQQLARPASSSKG